MGRADTRLVPILGNDRKLRTKPTTSLENVPIVSQKLSNVWFQTFTGAWDLMSPPTQSIQRLLVLLGMEVQESGMLEALLKEFALDTDSASFFIEDTLASRRKLVRERSVRQQVQDLALAIKQGEV